MKKYLLLILTLVLLTGCDMGVGWQDDCKNEISDDVRHFGQPDEHIWVYDDYSRLDSYYWYDRHLNIDYYTSQDSYGCDRYTYYY